MAHENIHESGQSFPLCDDEKENYRKDRPSSLEDIEAAAEPMGEPDGAIHQILSKTLSCTSCKDPGPPPDGGLQAWTQAVMCHLIVVNTWGYITSFGVFQVSKSLTLNL